MDGEPKKILVADSVREMGERCQGFLTTAGYEVVVCADLQGAIEAIEGQGFSLAVLETGLAAADPAALSQAAVRKAVVVLCAGNRDDATVMDVGLRIGARGHVQRPFQQHDLVEKVESGLALRSEVLAGHEATQGSEFKNDEVRALCSKQDRFHQELQENYFLELSKMMTIIGNIMDGIVFVDSDQKISLLNPVAEDLLGVKAFLALGMSVKELSGHSELIEAMCDAHERVEKIRERSCVVELHHNEQDLLYIKLQTSTVLDYRGQPAGVLSVLKDVTAEHKSDQLKNQYLSIVAHELRTPLTGIKTFSTMMAKGALGDLTDSQQRVVESIREQSLRLEHQIDKLINLGHLESNEYGQDLEVFDLVEFVQSVIAPFQQPAKERGIRLTLHLEGGQGVELNADRSDLRRACQALVENSVKFTPDGGTVSVELVPDEESLSIVVGDNGIGIDPRYHRRVFEKFFQVEDPLTRHHGGAGLGLFVAKGIIESHGGKVHIDSKLGQGARFSFRLPVFSPELQSTIGEEPGSTSK